MSFSLEDGGFPGGVPWSPDPQVLDAIRYLHLSTGVPIVHRAVRCDHVFLDAHQGDVKLGSFDIATYKVCTARDPQVLQRVGKAEPLALQGLHHNPFCPYRMYLQFNYNLHSAFKSDQGF